MKIVILERSSVGADVSVDCIRELGETAVYDNTVTLEEVRERVKDADIVIANKSPLRRETLEDAKKKFVGPNPNILALPQTFKLSAVHLMMKDEVYNGKGAEDCQCAAHMHG